MNSKVMQRMLWKDARSMMTLLAAALLSTAGFYLLLLLLHPNSRAAIMLAHTIWGLMPMVVAMGAPAVLIGGEEESGSLEWLRLLPTSWRQITLSKLSVGLAGFLISFGFATLCLFAFLTLFREDSLREFYGTSTVSSYAEVVLPILNVGLVLMLVSFATAFCFRSPITALVMVVPSLLFLIWVYVGTANAYDYQPWRISQDWSIGTHWLVMLAEILLLSGLVHAFAYRRLRLPRGSGRRARVVSISQSAYRPPSSVLSVPLEHLQFLGRPGQWRVLFWSQLRPLGWQLGALAVVGILCAVLRPLTNFGPWSPLFALGTSLSLFMIGSMTFYSDAVRDRCQFFFDRGISTTRVWFSRLATTALVSAFVLVVSGVFTAMLSGFRSFSIEQDLGFAQLICVAIAGFAVLQLVSQWSPRPTLSFFAGPIAFGTGATALIFLLSFYQDAYPIVLLSAAILLFASWWLMPLWMARQTRSIRYVVPFVLALVAATVFPYLVVLSVRYMTTPAEMTAWRQSMTTRVLPVAEFPRDKDTISSAASAARLSLSRVGVSSDQQSLRERIDAELQDPNAIGEYVSFDILVQLLSPQFRVYADHHSTVTAATVTVSIARGEEFRALQLDVVRVLQKWSRVAREQAVIGDADFNVVLTVAESADLIVAKALEDYRAKFGETEEWQALVDALPDPQLVKQSREYSLVRGWKQFQVLPVRVAGGYVRPPLQWWLGVERLRSHRYVDELVQRLLIALDRGQPLTDEQRQEIDRLADAAYLGPAVFYAKQTTLSEWVDTLFLADDHLHTLRSH